MLTYKLRILTPLIIIWIVTAVAISSEQTQEIDSDMQTISSFLIELIAKYDESGAGTIPLNKYPLFLQEVFITGQSLSDQQSTVDNAIKDLLLEATTAFATKYNTTEVGIQQFYTDLLKDFSIFLTDNNQKYAVLIDKFLADLPEMVDTQQADSIIGQSLQL